MKQELVLAVPARAVWREIAYQPKAVMPLADAAVMEKLLWQGVFGMRPMLEENPEYKQIIPYAVICCGDEVYLFRRTQQQSEKRLHNLYSLGVGGHMNPCGSTIDVPYMRHELEREMNEEVMLLPQCKVQSFDPVGFINDDTNEVGKVHLGVLYEIQLSNTDIEVNEKDKMTGQWVKRADLGQYYDGMETWSQLYCSAFV